MLFRSAIFRAPVELLPAERSDSETLPREADPALEADEASSDPKSPLVDAASDPQGPAATEILARHAATLALIRQAADKPACRFVRDWSRPSFGMLLPEVQSLRNAARLLALAARREAAEGDAAAAVRDIVGDSAIRLLTSSTKPSAIIWSTRRAIRSARSDRVQRIPICTTPLSGNVAVPGPASLKRSPLPRHTSSARTMRRRLFGSVREAATGSSSVNRANRCDVFVSASSSARISGHSPGKTSSSIKAVR